MHQKQQRHQSVNSMIVREFVLEDLYYINQWLAQRDRPPIVIDELPKAGWVVEDTKPVGMVFLRMIEGDLAMIDSMINDPNQTSFKRHQINDRLFLQCIKIAKLYKLNGLIGNTIDAGTLKRAINHGFTPSKHVFASWVNKEIE